MLSTHNWTRVPQYLVSQYDHITSDPTTKEKERKVKKEGDLSRRKKNWGHPQFIFLLSLYFFSFSPQTYKHTPPVLPPFHKPPPDFRSTFPSSLTSTLIFPLITSSFTIQNPHHRSKPLPISVNLSVMSFNTFDQPTLRSPFFVQQTPHWKPLLNHRKTTTLLSPTLKPCCKQRVSAWNNNFGRH